MEIDLVKENFIKNVSFESAEKNLKPVIKKTDLIYSDYFSKLSDNQVYIKPENLQVTGSFKIRGAYNTMSKLHPVEMERGVITSSAGNHAQGVAFSAQRLGVKATIVMPETTPLIKVNATKSYGVDVVLAGDVYDDCYDAACILEKEHKYRFIHPFNDINVIEGQGTIAREILRDLPDTDIILVPVGGGGLISGIAMAAKEINPDIKIIGVEPENAASMKESLSEKQVITLDKVNTIADGTAVKTPGTLNYYIVSKYVDDIITVSDTEVMEVFIELLQKHKLLAEGSGCLALAASQKINYSGKKVVSLISGGNIDLLTVSDLINKGSMSLGRIYTFSVDVLHKPGQLQKISALLGDLGANIISVRHNSRAAENMFSDINLEIAIEANGLDHVNFIKDELRLQGYKIKTLYD